MPKFLDEVRMEGESRNRKSLISLVCYYILFYGSMNFMVTYLSLFFKNNMNMSASAIGIISMIGPAVSVISQPLWGMAADRAKSKNNVLAIQLIIGLVMYFSYVLIPAGRSYTFALLLIVSGLASIGYQGCVNLSDTICLETLAGTRYKFDTVRSIGSFAYAFVALCVGVSSMVLNKDYNPASMLVAFSVVMAASLIPLFTLPHVRGHQSEKGEGGGKKVPITAIFKYKELIKVFAFGFLIAIPHTFALNFFPIVFSDMGASNALINIYIFISAFTEVPFIFIAGKLSSKFSHRTIVIAGALVSMVRYLLFALLANPAVLLITSPLLGIPTVVMVFSNIVYINKIVSPELKASGQAMWSFLVFSAAKIISCLVGGFMLDHMGRSATFGFWTVWSLVIVVIFYFLLPKHKLSDIPDQEESVNTTLEAADKKTLTKTAGL